TASRFPGAAQHLDDPFGNLRDLGLEEGYQELRVGAGKDDLGPPGLPLDVQEKGSDALSFVVRLPRHLLRWGQQGLGAPQVDNDPLGVYPLDDAVDDLALAVFEILKN